MEAITTERQILVEAVIQKVRKITAFPEGQDVSLSGLKQIRDILLELSLRADLFPDEHFPAPEEGVRSTLYELSLDADLSHALYVYRPRVGVVSPVHDHTTWAVVAGVRGVETNLVWRRLDADEKPGQCVLAMERLINVGPGQGVYYRAKDIHSISIPEQPPVLHLHLYGHSLLNLPKRLDFDPSSGTYAVQINKPTVLFPVNCGR